MANKWMQKLDKLRGAVNQSKDRFAKVMKTFSPSANMIYGRTHGLPFGYTSVLFGPPKGGKSVLSHMMIGWLHQTDPEAIAIKFDTEYRSDGQLDEKALALYGIDPDRLKIVQSNTPQDVFDQIEQQIGAMCQAGAPIKLIVVDSISGVQGRREMETESVVKQTIGDHAQTIQIGLKRILPIIRDNDIALVLVCQIRAEMDVQEQRRGKKFKMQGSYGLQHVAEYFISVRADKRKAGRQDINGRDLVNESVEDLDGNAQQVAMKILMEMEESSMGPKGRAGSLTFHFKYGLVNAHEEVFQMAKNYKIALLEKNTWSFGGESWGSKEKFLTALKERQDLRDAIVAEFVRRDLNDEFIELDSAAAVEPDPLEEE